MPWRRWQRHRYIRPIRVLSISLGGFSILLATVLVGYIRATPNPPPIFRFALVTLSMETWAALFALSGLLILIANVARRWARLAHALGCGVYTWWGLVLTFATIDRGVVTSGYSFAMLIAALAHWVCAAYWDAENSDVRHR